MNEEVDMLPFLLKNRIILYNFEVVVVVMVVVVNLEVVVGSLSFLPTLEVP